MLRKILKKEEIQVKSSTGVIPLISYEPWVLRSIESVKQSLIDGNPVLIRLHSAASYPCLNKSDNYKLDLESHAVLIVGYDDNDKTFDIVDPWSNKLGSKKGIYKLSYEVYPIVCVNCSLSKDTVITSNILDINKIENTNTIEFKYGFYLPKGYIIDKNNTKLSEITFKINYKINGLNKYVEFNSDKQYSIGEYFEFNLELDENVNEEIIFDINVNYKISGERPYKYIDNIETNYSIIKKINTSEKSDDKENLNLRIS